MRFAQVTALLLAALAPVAVSAQDIVYDAEHNASSIVGTWSSGAMNVRTGPGFAQPANQTFTYPTTPGVSYSFSADGFYEVSRYRFVSNASHPNCITGTLVWVHGNYNLLPNGSMVLTPFGDGYQQVQNPCLATSNFIQDYNQTELFQSWRIFHDATNSFDKLHLFQYDGQPVAPQFRVSVDPTMLPPQKLRNSTAETAAAGGKGKRHFFKRALSLDSWF